MSNNMATENQKNWQDHILNIKDYPKKGINFKDITPLIGNGAAFKEVTDLLANLCENSEIKPDILACPEARGFMFGSALAYRLGIGFLPVRKPNKLPREVCSIKYELEYGTDELQMHKDDIKKGQRIVLVDDVLATGGTMAACVKLIEQQGAIVTACVFVMEIESLKGKEKIISASKDIKIISLIKY